MATFELVGSLGSASVTLTAGQSIAVYTAGTGAQVFQTVGYPNIPSTQDLLGIVSEGQTVFGPFANGAVLTVVGSSGFDTYYTVGLSPVVPLTIGARDMTVAAETAAATISAADILGGIVTLTQATGATVALTLDTGALMETATQWADDMSVEWSLINLSSVSGSTGTITASSSHTIVAGSAVVAIQTSARFATRRTASGTFVTYRLA
jgi:hypothetical protein